jgi:hypothetical protein
MSEFQHTPGPWQYLGDPDDDECRVRQAASVRIGHGYCSEITICEGISLEANAKLIAAAPDLLEALIDVRRALELANLTGELAVVDSAIEKATS